MQTLSLNDIEERLIRILKKVHTHPLKKILEKHNNRFSFACPYCGDSSSDFRKKRGNIYYDTLQFKCFNEDCKASLIKFFSDFEEDLELEQKLELLEKVYTFKKINTDVNLELISDYLDSLIDIKQLIDWSNLPDSKFKIKSITKGSSVDRYLEWRKIFNRNNLWHGTLNGNDCVVILNTIHDKVLSLQIRSLKGKYYRFYNFSTLYRTLFKHSLGDEQIRLYDKFGQFFGLFNINFSKPVVVCEGYFDSTFFQNSIATVGLNADISSLLDSGLDIKWVYDNDPINIDKPKYIPKSMVKSKKMLMEGKSVFLWSKFLYEEKLPKTIKDINMAIIAKPQVQDKLLNYFSNDTFDLLYL